jgi:hypothetical protein
MLTTVTTIHAQPSFASLYETFMADGHRSSSSNSSNKNKNNIRGEKGSLARCLKCPHMESCRFGHLFISVPPIVVYLERVWEGLWAFAVTFEVLVRGFTLGFGIRMLTYLFFEHEHENENENENATKLPTTRHSIVKSFRHKALLSAMAGLSLAAFFHGSSLFVPAGLREQWFGHDNGHGGADWNAASTTSLPLALYDYIERTMLEQYEGNMEACPSNCRGEICTAVLIEILLDWTAYGLGRVGTGLAYLVTTLEVLLRGFSLGFGARMLKFLFVPETLGGNRTTNSKSKSKSQSKSKSPSLSADYNERSDPSHRERDQQQLPHQQQQQQGDVEATTEVIDARLVESIRYRALVSAISGVSVAAVVHGSSLFIPTEIRDKWFEY